MVVLLMDFTVLYICKLKYYLCFRIVFIIGKNNALYKVKILHMRFKKKDWEVPRWQGKKKPKRVGVSAGRI